MRPTIATATESNSAVSAPVRLSATVPVPADVAQGGGLAVDPGDAVEDELGEEGVEVGEVPVQHALGAARLGGDGPAGQRVRPVAEQDPLGGVEQLLADVADGHPGRHCALPSLIAVDEWARAHYGGRMPTIPSARHPTARAHRHRQVAESFGADAERYDRTRPRYPEALVDGSSPPARPRRPRRRLRHRHRGPPVPGGRLHGARGRADARMAEFARRRARRSRWRRSRPGTRPAGRSTRSSPGRPGTGSTRSPARPRRRRRCDPAAGSPCSGTSSTPHPTWRRPSPRATAGWCPKCRCRAGCCPACPCTR